MSRSADRSVRRPLRHRAFPDTSRAHLLRDCDGSLRSAAYTRWRSERLLERGVLSLSHRLASPLSEFPRTTIVQQQLLNWVQIAGFINGIIAYICLLYTSDAADE